MQSRIARPIFSKSTATMVSVDEFELPDGRKVRFTERALENLNGHDNCAFCPGRAAAHRGDGEDTNPHTDVPEGRQIGMTTDCG
jgi:hypothetical protein